MMSSGAYCEDSIEDEIVLQGSAYAGPHRESACTPETLLAPPPLSSAMM